MSHLAQRNVLAAYLGLMCLMGTGLLKGCELPDINLPVVVTPDTPEATQVTYVYEKDDGAIPSGVEAGIDQLKRQGYFASKFEHDTRDGNGDVPEQYRVVLPAAENAGLPALVVANGETVIRVLKAPTTKEQVVEAPQ